ncbi:MAG: electron transport complex subunit RsxC [Clostridia bacterium]|nr:electron transport complex subunit RsxC [Clostridia bacterium]
MRTFHGGIHPGANKDATCHKPIVDLLPPDELVFPLSQHIGAPAKPCVKVGDRVLVGQKIAEAQGFVSANLHSSVSGTVSAIEKRMHPNGTQTESIIIKNDGLDEVSLIPECDDDYTKKSPQELIEIIREAGIVGMGGATFPTHVKLSVPPEAKIDYVIINGAECEPYLTSDHRAMLETPDELIRGLLILMHIFGLEDGYIGIENNKKDAIDLLRSEVSKIPNKKIHIVPLKTKYPQGAEKQLIYAVSKRKVAPGTLPWQSGCIVNNIDTCASISRAVTEGKTLTRRIVTLGGDAIKNPMNYRVRIGTPFSYLVEQSGGLTCEAAKIIMGGPMMGLSVPSIDVPVIKGTSGIMVLSEKTARLSDESSCIRCAKCVYVCPMKLQPNLLDIAARKNDTDTLLKLNVTDCIECGSCAFVCPSKRRQVQQIKVAKSRLREAQSKKG